VKGKLSTFLSSLLTRAAHSVKHVESNRGAIPVSVLTSITKPYRQAAARLRFQADILNEVAKSLSRQGVDAAFVERQAWACGVEASLLMQGVPPKTRG